MLLLGHDLVKDALKRLVAHGPVPSVLMLGPPHVGKLTAALDLARSWLCPLRAPSSCTCASCQKVRAGQHTELERISSETATIDQLRGVVARSYTQRADCKVVVIDRLDLYDDTALQVLLKALEEPRGGTSFVLTARREPLRTIMSRSWCLRFGRLARDDLSLLLGRPMNDVEAVMADGRVRSVRDRLTYLHFILDRHGLDLLPDKLDAQSLRDDLDLAVGCLHQAVKLGQDSFGPVTLPRLSLDKAAMLLSVFDRAVELLDARVQPWLVFEWLRTHLQEILR